MSTRILPSLALVLTAVIFFAYVNPTWTGSIAATRAAIAADDQSLAAAAQYSAQQNQLAEARNAINPTYLDALATFLPDSVSNVGLILDLNALAARTGLSISSIDVITSKAPSASNDGALPTSSPDADPVGSVDLSLSAVGTFSALNSFLSGIERSARLLDVQDIVVQGSDTGVYHYQMRIRFYWLR